MHQHTTKSQLKVDGKMSEAGADCVGKLQCVALIILSLAALVTAAGYVIWLLK